MFQLQNTKHAALPEFESGVATDAVYGTPSAGGGQGAEVISSQRYYHYHNNYYIRPPSIKSL